MLVASGGDTKPAMATLQKQLWVRFFYAHRALLEVRLS